MLLPKPRISALRAVADALGEPQRIALKAKPSSEPGGAEDKLFPSWSPIYYMYIYIHILYILRMYVYKSIRLSLYLRINICVYTYIYMYIIKVRG